MLCKTLQLQEEEFGKVDVRMKLIDMEIVIYTCQVLKAFLFPLLRVSIEGNFQQTIRNSISTKHKKYNINQTLYYAISFLFFRVRLINLTSTFYKILLTQIIYFFYFEYLPLNCTRSMDENLSQYLKLKI